LIEKWEGLVLTAGQDIAGVLTIGYGHTPEQKRLGSRLVIPEVVLAEHGRADESAGPYVEAKRNHRGKLVIRRHGNGMDRDNFLEDV
jgi:GH24 family phage-related lysozyme (muramidase)